MTKCCHICIETMKILIADHSEFSVKSISKTLETQTDKEIVGIAESGQEALGKAEQLQPDLIIMNLEIVYGIAATKIITKKHPTIKIIILSSSANKFDTAINAGARGVLMRGTPEKDFIAAIDAVMRDCTVYLSQQEPSKEIAPEQFSFIKNWNYLLAAETINFWLSKQQENIDFEKSLKILGIAIRSNKFINKFDQENEIEFDYIKLVKQGDLGSIDLFEELEIRLKYLFENLPVNLDSLKYIEKDIDKWYTGNKLSTGYTTCSVALEKNSQILKTELNIKFQNLVNSFWGKTSIKSSLDYLRKLKIFLFTSTSQYEEKKKEFMLKERGCLKVYNEHVSAISIDDNDLDRNYDIAKKALLKSYTLKLEAEICSRASQALEMIMQSNQLYIDDLNNTYLFLTQIRENCLAKSDQNAHILLPLLFEQMSRQINPDNLRKEMEQALGHSLQKWGIYGGISVEEVESILLKKLNPLTQKICSQIYDQLQELRQEDLKNSTFNQLSTEIEAS